MLDKIKEWGPLVSALAIIVGGAIWIGALRSDVTHLAQRVSKLEKQGGGQRKVYLGDICFQLMQSLESALDDGAAGTARTQAIENQLKEFRCSDAVEALAIEKAPLSNREKD